MVGIFKFKRDALLGYAAVFGMIVALYFLMDWLVMPLYTKHWQQVELPDVVEYHFNDAENILEEAGFKMVPDAVEFHPTLPESTIIFQKPAAYTNVKKGRRIYVTLSAGEQLAEVPRLMGTSEREAILSLRQAKLEVGEIHDRVSTYPQHVVCDQELPSGTQLKEKTPVDFTVSLGKRKEKYTVPDLLNRSYKEALRMIKREGLETGQISYVYRPDLLPETVVRQVPEAGQETAAGYAVDLQLSTMEPDTIRTGGVSSNHGESL